VLLVRPGESLNFADGAARVVRSAGHEWPYGDPATAIPPAADA
jgi:hypothetical protein